MTREQRLEYCTICLNRKMNFQKGLLCGLSNELATFETECTDFKVDNEEKGKKLIRDLAASGHQDASQSLDFKKNKTNGAIIFFVGVAILLFTINNLNGFGILIIPVGIISYGLKTYYKGEEQEKVIEKREQFDKQTTNKSSQKDSANS